jgi:hypothetical protein
MENFVSCWFFLHLYITAQSRNRKIIPDLPPNRIISFLEALDSWYTASFHPLLPKIMYFVSWKWKRRMGTTLVSYMAKHLQLLKFPSNKSCSSSFVTQQLFPLMRFRTLDIVTNLIKTMLTGFTKSGIVFWERFIALYNNYVFKLKAV